MNDARSLPKFGVGQSVHRLEDPRLLTGQGQYTDDVSFPNETHGIVLRSPHAHASIRSIDTSAAMDVEGVLGIYTAADITDLGTIQCMAPIQQADGSALKTPPYPILATGKAVYVGQPVAFVVAETVSAAKATAELIEVDYDTHPAIVDTAGANDTTAPQVWDDIADNTSFVWRDGDHAATSAAIADAPRKASLRVVNNRLIVASIEPRIAIGEWDGIRFTLTTTSQGPHSLRLQLAEHLFKLPEDTFRVVTHDVGGGFGIKFSCTPNNHSCFSPLAILAVPSVGPGNALPTLSQATITDATRSMILRSASMMTPKFWLCPCAQTLILAHSSPTSHLISPLNAVPLC